jgi:RHS repeat-associated protein
VDAVGLMDYGARFYDPALGRFVSADSLVPEPGNPQALNRYAYVLGNPLRYVDPSGHCPTPPAKYGRVICVALFIMQARVLGVIGGDGREFSTNSDEERSRAWIWISADTGEKIDQKVNVSKYYVPLSDLKEYGPDAKNKIQTKRLADGSIDLEYDLAIAVPKISDSLPNPTLNRLFGPLLDRLQNRLIPRLNGHMQFRVNSSGHVDHYMNRDGYPWAEAYLYDGKGGVEKIFTSSALPGLPPMLLFSGEWWLANGVYRTRYGEEIPRIIDCKGGYRC